MIRIFSGSAKFPQIGFVESAVQERLAAQSDSTMCILYQNIPEPFYAWTVIRFWISSECRVLLTIYDSLGRKVQTVADATYGSGFHEVTWNALKFGSGVYFCKLEAGKFVASKPITVMN